MNAGPDGPDATAAKPVASAPRSAPAPTAPGVCAAELTPLRSTALERKQRASPPVPKLLDGEQEAQVIALRTGSPPKGYANWSLRLLARRVVELAIVESISHETVRRTLKKTG